MKSFYEAWCHSEACERKKQWTKHRGLFNVYTCFAAIVNCDDSLTCCISKHLILISNLESRTIMYSYDGGNVSVKSALSNRTDTWLSNNSLCRLKELILCKRHLSTWEWLMDISLVHVRRQINTMSFTHVFMGLFVLFKRFWKK